VVALEEQLNQATQTPVGPQDTFCEKCDIKAKQIDKLENKLQIIKTKFQDIETYAEKINSTEFQIQEL